MIEKSVTQYLYDETFKQAEKLVANVYDVLPLEDVPYPFINFGEVNMKSDRLKGSILHDVVIDVHIWGNRTQRSKVDNIAYHLMNLLLPYGLQPNKTKTRLITDNSTNEILFHNVLELHFQTGKGVKNYGVQS